MILVIARAFQFDRLVIEKETILRIEPDRANAKGSLVAIDDIAAGSHLRHKLVKVPLLERP